MGVLDSVRDEIGISFWRLVGMAMLGAAGVNGCYDSLTMNSI